MLEAKKKTYKSMMSNSLFKSKFANCYFIRSAIKTKYMKILIEAYKENLYMI